MPARTTKAQHPKTHSTSYSVQVRSHTGSVREHNEDAASTVLDWRTRLQVDEPLLQRWGHLFAVADGMGGHAAGEVASRVAIDTLFRNYYGVEAEQAEGDIETRLRQAIGAANEAVIQQARTVIPFAGMGTTLVAAVLHGDDLTIANVGDSRAYLFRNGQIEQITRDHSWVAEQVAAGVLAAEEAARHPYRNVITRSLGPDRDSAPDTFREQVRPGDILLLCSDGLSNIVSEKELAQFLSSYPLDEAANIILEWTLERGAPDNVTFVLVEVLKGNAPPTRRGWLWPAPVLAVVLVLLFLFRDPLWALMQKLGSDFFGLAAAPRQETRSPLPASLHLPDAQVPVAVPLVVGEIELSAAAGNDRAGPAERFGDAEAGLKGLPRPERYVYYVSGPLDLVRPEDDAVHLAVVHRSPATDSRHRYSARLPGLDLQHIDLARGEIVRLVGRPISTEPPADEISLEPLLLTNEQGRMLWVAGGELDAWLDATGRVWVYTVYGPGGSEGLGISAPPPLDGHRIALWGRWQREGHKVVFQPLDPAAYEYEDGVYRLPDN
ncbi:MAG: Stp1/IreP family PP2C-type Ser/Thr phosphatase [Caldilineae bacterium]|nr:MAG: Stp1/IreP family PP2C-type Ser/Thr phosphatase [Caldilineae bacterium]